MLFKFNQNITINALTLEELDVYQTDAVDEINIISFIGIENLEINQINI